MISLLLESVNKYITEASGGPLSTCAGQVVYLPCRQAFTGQLEFLTPFGSIKPP